MAVGGGWFRVGFWPGEGAGGPEPVRVSGAGRALRPSWSFVGIVAAGSSAVLQGAERAALPGDCRDLLPSETHVVLRREAALEAWRVGAGPALLDGEPAWRRELRAEEGEEKEETAEAGDLYMWGWNESGQLGLPCKGMTGSPVAATAEADGGSTPPRGPRAACESPPAAFISIQAFPALLDMPGGVDVRKVSCGSRHTAALTRTGELYTWGWGKYGQLGHRNTAASDRPKKVCSFEAWGLGVADVVCGPWTTFALALLL
ncbi:UNVERIFIED_CONTAM: hypothetical protein K2H54_020462 [Gekko kuhli]